MYTDVVAAQDRGAPPVIYRQGRSTGELDQALVDAGVGLLNIRSVYDVDGVDTALPEHSGAGRSRARDTPTSGRRASCAIVKAVSIPDDDVYDFSEYRVRSQRRPRA